MVIFHNYVSLPKGNKKWHHLPESPIAMQFWRRLLSATSLWLRKFTLPVIRWVLDSGSSDSWLYVSSKCLVGFTHFVALCPRHSHFHPYIILFPYHNLCSWNPDVLNWLFSNFQISHIQQCFGKKMLVGAGDWYTIYHHLPVVTGENKPLYFHQPTFGNLGHIMTYYM